MSKVVKSFSFTFTFFIIHSFHSNISNAAKFRKCCPPNHILQLNTTSLVLTTFSDDYNCVLLPKLKKNGTSLEPLLHNYPENGGLSLEYWSGDTICTGSWSFLHNRADKWFEMRQDVVYIGLNFWQWPAWLSVDNSSYCVDNVSLNNDSSKKEDNDITAALIFCGELDNFNAYLAHRILYVTLFFISSGFVFLTLVIYGVLWADQNTHGCTQISFFLAVLFFHILEGLRIVVKLNGFYIVPSTACFLHAVFAHYFFVCVNTTSAVMGFDLLWIFWNLNPSAYKVKNWKRIYVYSIISWLLPLLGIILGLLLHHFTSPEEAKRNENGLFEFAHYRCSSPLWHATFYIQALLVVLNILFFGISSTLIWKHRNNSSAMASRTTQKYLSESIIIFSKLFFVLGMTWVAIVIEFFLGEKNPLSYSWLILRVLNLLLGAVYFILFGTNRKNLKSLRQKYGLVDRVIIFIRLKDFTEESQAASLSKKTASTE